MRQLKYNYSSSLTCFESELTTGINGQHGIRNLAEGTKSGSVLCCYLKLIDKSSTDVGDLEMSSTDHRFAHSLPQDAVAVFHLKMVAKHVAATI